MLAALSSGGCTTTCPWSVDHKTGQIYQTGPRYTFDPDKAAAVSNELAAGVGQFATGYANAAAREPAVNPNAPYSPSPSYAQPLEQHGTATITPIGFGSFGAPSYHINY